jgi:uncharacterized protein YndB with AHSA1/START domain
MNLASTDVSEIVQEITIAASAERIFRALTDPSELLRWWAAPGKFHAIEVETDPQPGGTWRMCVQGGCDPNVPLTVVSGRYLEVAPPHRLAYTWLRETESDPETTVRWDLEEHNGSTTVRVTHSGFPSERMRMRNNGWPVIQDLLRQYLQRHA